MTDTKTVTIDGVEFTIRLISKRKWVPIWTKELDLFTSNFSRPSDDVKPASLGAQISDALAAMPAQQRITVSNELFENHWLMVKLGVMSHKNLKDRDGNEIAIVKDSDGNVADETIDLYFDRKYFVTLFSEISVFQQVSEEERKN